MPGAIRQGPEFRINTTTAGIQYEPLMQPLADGRVVVVWSDTSNGTDVDLRARIIMADGLEAVAEFVVTTTTGDHQYEPALTALAAGSFVVVWSDTSNGTDVDVRARIFRDDGSEAVGEFVVSSAVAGDQFEPTVTTLADGRFVVVWADNNGASCDIRARIFNADGSESVAEFVVNSTTANSQYEPVIVALADGRFLVSWTDDSRSGGDASELAIRASVFNSDGSQAVPEFLVNTTTPGSQLQSSTIALADGRVVIAWTDYSAQAPDQSSGAVRARIFNADFTPAADDFVVNATVCSYQARPAMTALADGGFVVAWEDLSTTGGDGSLLAVRAQQFTAAGARAGPEFLVNTATASAQFGPAIAALGDGRILVTWTDFSQTDGDASNSAVHGQVFDLTEYAPVITSNGGGNLAATAVAENTRVVTTVRTTDPNGDAPAYSIVGGADAALFQINVATGVLSFIAAPDFEAPTDAGSNNRYEVVVRASDGTLFDDQAITIDVTNADGINLSGDGADNRLAGSPENDTISGLGGNDRLEGGAGDDRLIGGTGNDTYVVDSTLDQLLENPGEGIDVVFAGAHFALFDNVEHLVLLENAGAIDGTGNAGANTIFGNSFANTLSGGLGIDALIGGGGDDILIGGGEHDGLAGGTGNDTYIVDSTWDQLLENPVEGMDLVQASAHFGLFDNVEQLVLLENAGAINGTGTGGDNTIVGNSSANVVDGGGGNDVVIGGAGNDIIIGGAGNDVLTGGVGSDYFAFAPSFGHDTITDFAPSADALIFDHTLFASVAAVQAAMVQVGTDTVITLDAGNTLTLQNVIAANLTHNHVLFS